MDDIRPQDLPDGPPASEGQAPARKEQPRTVGPEGEDRGGPEAPDEGLPEPLDPAVKG
ncbi:MAG: hypothetical protein J0H19_19125 [Rhodospirillales bacterium]|nr:hypothetical protein [Rhodospirillales bacterium]MBN8928728.1 hypothetical protein [Rhodospirillales bacterium]